ncbi:hypothetical protein AEP_01610 [Curvibacter sp. AEP1-3]|uniref:hypothetical protein n=1 Tax=Curvibacter sp. AEP1-3 TaxID=1844971 RepID=UPI000B3BE047|nr:hypothetical protein [Curvibacter sp. AEP1-3]ARV18554.1 hypothetical protein AEP_01610 [Curvibacter sp. AEP1-3]
MTEQAVSLPDEFLLVQDAALKALVDLEPAGPPRADAEGRGLFLSARTNGGRSLPAYYLVYFLLIDFLKFPSLGQWEKSAWAVPVRFRDRLYVIEHRKMGLGVFAPNLDPAARMSGTPSEQAEEDARAITALITKAVSIAEPYFQWRAEQAVSTPGLNVVNKTYELFSRYVYFRDRFHALSEQTETRRRERNVEKRTLSNGAVITSGSSPSIQLRREAIWNAQAAIEAFFSWTEHVFIHLAILQGKLKSGDEVARLAESDWKAKFKEALSVAEPQTKLHYDKLLDLRAQVRNFVAHGAFGKQGEAFRFHSGAGAAPVLLTNSQKHKYSLTGSKAFDERLAIADIESFLLHLWSESRAPARSYVFSSLPSILTYAVDGTYARAMLSDEEMKLFVEHLTGQFDRAADMDW